MADQARQSRWVWHKVVDVRIMREEIGNEQNSQDVFGQKLNQPGQQTGTAKEKKGISH